MTQNVQNVFRACGNCNYSPWLEKAETQNAKEWMDDIVAVHRAAQSEYLLASEAYKAKETTLTMGKYNRAKRGFEAAEKRLQIAEAISKVVELQESGQITLLLPGLGLFQFEWGAFNLFKAIAK